MIFVCRNGEHLGEFSEAEFREKILAEEILPSDDYWQEGFPDWVSVAEYRDLADTQPTNVRRPAPHRPQQLAQAAVESAAAARPVAAKRKLFERETTLTIGVACALIAAFGPLFSQTMLVLSVPLLIAAFVLAIISMVKGRIAGGIALLMGTFIAGPISCATFFGGNNKLLPASHERAAAAAQQAEEDKARELDEVAAQGKVRVGMTAEQCERAWGKPTKINRTRTSRSTHEQWVYDRGDSESEYLFVDDGLLRSVHTSR